MATIKEKAEEYSFIGQGIGPSGIQYRDFSKNKKDAFIEGANYVLDEIEPLINLLRSGARVLFKEKIKELKGE